MLNDFLDKHTSNTPTIGSREITSIQFDDEIRRKKEILNSWFEQLQSLNFQREEILKMGKHSIYASLLSSLEKALQEYENERNERPDLQLPDIPEESLNAMLLLFPFLYGKDYSFFIDSDLACVAVVICPNKHEQITIATKSSTLLILSKVGESEGTQLPFSLASTLKLSGLECLKEFEQIISFQ